MKQSKEFNFKSELWYRKEIQGLIYILSDASAGGMIASSYVKEKLNMIMSEQGINFHPVVRKLAEKEINETLKSI